MLEHLSIHNFALIENVEIDFPEGFSIITGDTGAGKSIMLAALGLLRGARNDSRSGSSREKKTVVEASFILGSKDFETRSVGVEKLLEEEEIAVDADESGKQRLILRREILPSGRSKAYLNDAPVAIATLGAVASQLLDIHSQHASIAIADNEHQMQIVDAYAENEDILSRYREALRSYAKIRNKIKAIQTAAKKNSENISFLKFQLEQLDALNTRKGELKDVEREYDILSDADHINESLRGAINSLNEESGALASLTTAAQYIASLDENLVLQLKREKISERLQNSLIEIKDIVHSLNHAAADIEANPVLLAKVESRMNELYEAKKRFHLGETEDLEDFRINVRQQLSDIDNSDRHTEELEIEARKLAREVKIKGDQLTVSRKNAAAKLQNEIIAVASQLGLKNLQFEIKIEPAKFTPTGGDDVQFICSFNKNAPMLPLSKVASGGEMSRMMLSLRNILATKMSLPTVIFDEIDTGVSGEIADKMGQMMADMSKNMQVIAITHLPQVAAKGDSHYLVYKEDNESSTISNIKKLSSRQRERVIAGMLSGESVNEAALENARSLLGNKKI